MLRFSRHQLSCVRQPLGYSLRLCAYAALSCVSRASSLCDCVLQTEKHIYTYLYYNDQPQAIDAAVRQPDRLGQDYNHHHANDTGSETCSYRMTSATTPRHSEITDQATTLSAVAPSPRRKLFCSVWSYRSIVAPRDASNASAARMQGRRWSRRTASRRRDSS